MRVLFVLALVLAAVAARRPPFPHNRIIGGSVTDIQTHPEMVAMLNGWPGGSFSQSCGGIILNQRAILTAAHCFWYLGTFPEYWRARVGSTNANSGGSVHNAARVIMHPGYSVQARYDSDVGILHVATNLVYSNVVQRALIAGANYYPPDNAVVWAAGWGLTTTIGPASEQLRHVQIWTVNQQECVRRYATIGDTVTDNMICAGWLDVGGRDQCQGDSGGPLYHNGVVVGVCSWGRSCADPFFPGVNARVSRFTSWIESNV